MATATSDPIVRSIDERIGALRTELGPLEAALAALTRGETPRSNGKRRSNGARRSNGSKRLGHSGGRPRRDDDVLAVIAQDPGLSAREIAERCGMHVSSATRITGRLQQRRLVVKRGGGWHRAARKAPASS